MLELLRKLRGVAGLALTWGVVWTVIGAAVWTAIRFLDPDSIDPGEGLVRTSAIIGAVGCAAGAAFSTLLALAERRKTLGQLTLPRMIALGLIGTAALTLLTPIPNAMLAILAPLGAVCAAGSVGIARRAALRAPEHERLPKA